MLQTRIKFVCDLIENENLVVDVGSDHALLSINLIESKRALKVINVEKNDGPLKVSTEATKNYHEKIANIKSDGLKNIEPSLLINICTIMGMGGNTIVKILEEAKFKNVEKYILQPNNNEELIRIWAQKNDWKISLEELIKENEVIYEIICLDKKKGYYPKSKKEFFFGKLNIDKSSELFRKKWKDNLIRIQKNKAIIYNQKKMEIAKLISEVLNEKS